MGARRLTLESFPFSTLRCWLLTLSRISLTRSCLGLVLESDAGRSCKKRVGNFYLKKFSLDNYWLSALGVS
jgi:hypothetical protein